MTRRRALAIGGICCLLGACSPGESVPGQFQVTKPQMDREQEVGAPAVKPTAEAPSPDTVHGGLERKDRVKVRHGDDQPEQR
jgi:hypothetical protein